MSSYATLEQLKAHVGTADSPPGVYEQLVDLNSTGDAPDDTLGQQRLDDAEGLLNGKIGARYLTPVDVSADAALANTLRACALAFAAYNLFTQHPAKPRMRDTVKQEYERWAKWLDDVAAGRSALPGATVIPAAVSNGPSATAVGSDRVFTDCAMRDF